jgi:hypothetical protein
MFRRRKHKTKDAEASVEAASPNPNTREQIAPCAYYIWQAEGRPDGRDVEHWLQAELQLCADRTLEPSPLTEEQKPRIT